MPRCKKFVGDFDHRAGRFVGAEQRFNRWARYMEKHGFHIKITQMQFIPEHQGAYYSEILFIIYE